ncbi:hypothetical protein DPEC_G00063930 [Dallia pectoralis]|uniref:Uncharacterized protein n=1 Tax=Dallia pectoralis TaxID=75939 RepID=A0ACC2H8V1_DALPE|nr:hypothetical protein DPEC_G00063930 [Dallia pectoralis]
MFAQGDNTATRGKGGESPRRVSIQLPNPSPGMEPYLGLSTLKRSSIELMEDGRMASLSSNNHTSEVRQVSPAFPFNVPHNYGCHGSRRREKAPVGGECGGRVSLSPKHRLTPAVKGGIERL